MILLLLLLMVLSPTWSPKTYAFMPVQTAHSLDCDILDCLQLPVVQSLSCVRLFETPWTAAPQASLSITITCSLLKFMCIELVMPSIHIIVCHSLLLLPSIFLSIRVFPNELALPIRWPKYWRFSFSIGPSNEYSGLISFRIDWFDFHAVQGTLKSAATSQFKNIILQCSVFFMVQHSLPYMTMGKP